MPLVVSNVQFGRGVARLQSLLSCFHTMYAYLTLFSKICFHIIHTAMTTL